MKSFIPLIVVALSFHSCSMRYYAYIRNLSNKNAIIDVYLFDKKNMPTLPNQIKVADRIVKFKGGYRQQFFNTKNVVWLDLNHFQLELSPNTTADLTDMTGYWMNARCICDAKVTVTAGGKTDILVDGRFFNVRHELFSYGRKFSIIYYDVKPDSTVQASKN